tara:strand:+ start:134 stop:382 length:249 start_codon:yes stop_codon:yes gene_type:complete
VNITEIIENILRQKGWGLYDRQTPIQRLNLQGEAPLFKVNEVEFKYLKAEIENNTKEEEWKQPNSKKSSNLDGSQENTSQIG